MPSNREEKNEFKKKSFDLKTRDRREEEQDPSDFRHKTHKQMRRQRRNYESALTEEQQEELKAFLEEYATLSPVRLNYKMSAFTVPDLEFFVNNPEEFLRNRPRFGDVFEARSRKNRWLKATIAKELGADQVYKFLDNLSDEFLIEFAKLKNDCSFDTFVVAEDHDLLEQLTQWISKEVQ